MHLTIIMTDSLVVLAQPICIKENYVENVGG
jgi:hypothetical protein